MLRISMYILIAILISYIALTLAVFFIPNTDKTLYNITGKDIEKIIKNNYETTIDIINQKIDSLMLFIDNPAPNMSENIEGRTGK